MSPWRPLLEGRGAERAWRAVREIDRRIDEASPQILGNPTIASGLSGIAVFRAYLARAQGDDDAARARLALEQAAEALAGAHVGAGLFDGLAGTAWAAEHLRSWFTFEDDPNEGVDELLTQHVGRLTGNIEADLANGLVGLGVYARERLPAPGGTAVLEAVLAGLERSAEHRGQGITWRSLPGPVGAGGRSLHADGWFDLGMAHGVPGVVALLAAIAGDSTRRTEQTEHLLRHLLHRGTQWLVDQRLPSDQVVAFPCYRADGVEPNPARAAWCYGDPGVAVALLRSARDLGDRGLEETALGIARLTARRSDGECGVRGLGLCHGSAGLAHIFNRLYQASLIEELREAAIVWMEHALRDVEAVAAHEPGPGLLNGLAGAGLALLGFTSTLEPSWDRLLLVDVAPK